MIYSSSYNKPRKTGSNKEAGPFGCVPLNMPSRSSNYTGHRIRIQFLEDGTQSPKSVTKERIRALAKESIERDSQEN